MISNCPALFRRPSFNHRCHRSALVNTLKRFTPRLSRTSIHRMFNRILRNAKMDSSSVVGRLGIRNRIIVRYNQCILIHFLYFSIKVSIDPIDASMNAYFQEGTHASLWTCNLEISLFKQELLKDVLPRILDHNRRSLICFKFFSKRRRICLTTRNRDNGSCKVVRMFFFNPPRIAI